MVRNLKNPKCPECGNTIFAYQGVVPQLTLARALEETNHNNKSKIDDHLFVAERTENQSGGKKTPILHNLLGNVRKSQADVLVIYCPNCGTIIGTAMKDNK